MGKGFAQTFLRKRYTMSYKHMERYSTSLVTKEIQIKPTKRCHFTPTKTGNEKDRP